MVMRLSTRRRYPQRPGALDGPHPVLAICDACGEPSLAISMPAASAVHVCVTGVAGPVERSVGIDLILERAGPNDYVEY